jgi:hypothetical protein
MALIMTLLAWLDKRITRWVCNRYGHQGAKTIEVYHTILCVKNWRLIRKKLVFVHPYKQIRVNGKHKCTHCGAVFLGVIVKEESFHDKPHGMP